MTETHAVQIVSIDGGGVRGMTALRILQELCRTHRELIAKTHVSWNVNRALSFALGVAVRHGQDMKAVELPHECREGGKKLIIPDIVVHRRGYDDDNLLVIVMKKQNIYGSRDCDRAKIVAMKRELFYRYGLRSIASRLQQSHSLSFSAARIDSSIPSVSNRRLSKSDNPSESSKTR